MKRRVELLRVVCVCVSMCVCVCVWGGGERTHTTCRFVCVAKMATLVKVVCVYVCEREGGICVCV